MNSVTPSPEWTAQVIQWDADKGYGWLQWRDKRLFLHIRDYTGNGHSPQAGETLRFTLGQDAQGRPCAKQAESVRGGGRELPVLSLLVLSGLLILPTLALYHQAFSGLQIGMYVGGVSLLTYLTYVSDKRRARTQAWRIPEMHLHFLEVIGGWPAAWLAQKRLRHKSSKLSYQIKFWMIILLHQIAAYDSMQEWRLFQSLAAAVRQYV